MNFPATGRPTILGTVQVGGVLTVVTSGIGDGDGIPDGSFVYQWVRVDGGVRLIFRVLRGVLISLLVLMWVSV